MGHKEDLLDGAKRCLYEKGYARTTARDIVAASGTNLASIGYHYGSKENLLNAALMSATEDFGEAIGAAVDAAPPERRPLRALRARSSPASSSPYADLPPALERDLRVALPARPRRRGPGVLRRRPGHGPPRDQPPLVRHARRRSRSPTPTTSGSASSCRPMLIGLMGQMLIDPAQAPTGDDLAAALRTMFTARGGGLDPDVDRRDGGPSRSSARTGRRSSGTRRSAQAPPARPA